MADKFIYPRMFGYAATIVLHCVNTVYMALVLRSAEVRRLFEDPAVRFFNENQARYFTCWTFFLQVVYAAMGFACDYLTLKNAHQKDYRVNKHLRGTRDILFAGIQWPASLMVSSVFWGIFHFDRELILPQSLDAALTRVSNHIIHTAIVPVVLWEIVFRPREVPRSHMRNLFHLTLHYVVYFSVLFYTYYEKGSWIYPIFEKTAGTIYFPLFMLFIYLILLFFYFIQWPMTRFIHGDIKLSKNKTR